MPHSQPHGQAATSHRWPRHTSGAGDKRKPAAPPEARARGARRRAAIATAHDKFVRRHDTFTSAASHALDSSAHGRAANAPFAFERALVDVRRNRLAWDEGAEEVLMYQ